MIEAKTIPIETLRDLKDIKGVEQIPFDLLPYGIGLIIFLIVVLFGSLFVSYLRAQKDPKANQRKELKSILKYDYTDKEIAYRFTTLGFGLVSKEYKDEYEKIVRQLELHKYKKEVPPLDSDLKEQIEDFVKVRI